MPVGGGPQAAGLSSPRRWAAELLHVWFAVLAPSDWFGPSPAIDAMLRRRFEREWHALRHRPAEEFLSDPGTALAAILLFDQIPRNLFRGSARSFASDGLARRIAREALRRGWDRRLGAGNHGEISSNVKRSRASQLGVGKPVKAWRQFMAMPLMHSERIADQRRALAFYVALGGPAVLAFARGHHRMIARFGRFAHRNELLGRKTTAAERAALDAGFAW